MTIIKINSIDLLRDWPFGLDGTLLFRRVLVRRNFRYISLRLYFGHGRHNFWFSFFRFAVHRVAFLLDVGQSLGKAKRSPSKRSETLACHAVIGCAGAKNGGQKPRLSPADEIKHKGGRAHLA
jgi:hypothetical protein